MSRQSCRGSHSQHPACMICLHDRKPGANTQLLRMHIPVCTLTRECLTAAATTATRVYGDNSACLVNQPLQQNADISYA